MSSEGSNFLKIQKFDGTKAKYPTWSSQFEALCAIKGILDALQANFKNKLPDSDKVTLDPNDDAEKLLIEAKVKNSLAMSYLTLAMDSPQLLAKIEASKSNDWPGGLAHVLWAKLVKKYKPKDTIAVAEQMKKLMELKLMKGQDPETLGDKIAELETSYGSSLAEEQKVAAIVNAAGADYADVIQQETKTLTANGDAVTADDLVEAMSERWRISGSGKLKSVDESRVNLGFDLPVTVLPKKLGKSARYGNYQVIPR